MYYPEELINEVRQKNDIVDIIGQYVTLKPKGNSHFGLCPFHNEKTPSFSVSREKQMYYCFGCGRGGNVFTFLMEYENYTFQEAISHLADRVNVQLPEVEMSEQEKEAVRRKKRLYQVNQLAAKYYYYQLHHQAGRVAIDYLSKRQVSPTIAKKFGLGYAPIARDDLQIFLKSKGYSEEEMCQAGLLIADKKRQKSYYQRFFNRLMFPIFDQQQRVIAFGGRVFGEAKPKYLNSPETPIFNKSVNLYGLHLARSSRQAFFILAEGYMDVIRLHENGFNNAVASLGTAFTAGHAHLIRRFTDTVVVAYDSDFAGVKASLRAIPILAAEGLNVRVLVMEKAKDPDEYLAKYGATAFTELLESAISGFMFEIRQLATNYRLSDPAYRLRFIDEVIDKLLTLDSKLAIDHYKGAIIEEYDLDAEGFEEQLIKKGKNIGIAKDNREAFTKLHRHQRQKAQMPDVLPYEEELLSMMVTHSQIFREVSRHIRPYHFQSQQLARIAKIIFGMYENGRIPEANQVINHFSEVAEQKLIAGLFNAKVPLQDAKQLEKVLIELIRRIKTIYLKKELDDTTDSQKFQRLVAEKKALLSLNIDLRLVHEQKG